MSRVFVVLLLVASACEDPILECGEVISVGMQERNFINPDKYAVVLDNGRSAVVWGPTAVGFRYCYTSRLGWQRARPGSELRDDDDG